MKRSIILSILAFSLLLFSCSKEEVKQAEAKPKTEFEHFVDSFKAFQAAIERQDMKEIAEYIHFPLNDPYAEDSTIIYTQYNEENWKVEKTYPNTKEGFLAGGYELLFEALGRKARGLSTENHYDVIDYRFLNIKEFELFKEVELEKTKIVQTSYMFGEAEEKPYDFFLQYTFKIIDPTNEEYGMQNGMLFFFQKVDNKYKLAAVMLGS